MFLPLDDVTFNKIRCSILQLFTYKACLLQYNSYESSQEKFKLNDYFGACKEDLEVIDLVLESGVVAQLGERYDGIVEVRGSIPLDSTMLNYFQNKT